MAEGVPEQLEPLIDAVKSGDAARVEQLVSSDAHLASARVPSGESPLMAAVYRGHHAVVEVLIAAGAEIDVFAAAATGRVDDLRRGVADPASLTARSYDGWTPLHLAAFFGKLEAARVLLDSGADVVAVSANSLANTPLHAATAGKHAQLALLLFSRGGDPLARDAGGYTPLEIASQNGLASVVAAMTGPQR
jgi:uncharacterized protein